MRWSWIVLLVLMIPMAGAQINGGRDYHADYPFTDPASDEFITLVSGRLAAELGATQETWGFFEASGLRIDGIDEVCHRKVATIDGACRAGDYTVIVQEGGSVGFKLPTGRGTFAAAHTLAFFTGAKGDDINSLVLNETLVAPAIDGEMTFTQIGAPPGNLFIPNALQLRAAFGAILDDTVIEVREGGQVLFTVTKADGLVAFSGDDVTVPPFAVEAAALPFTVESEAHFSEAPAKAARQGIDGQRIAEVQRLLQRASAAGGTPPEDEQVQDNAVLDSLAEVLDAALIRMPVDFSKTSEEAIERELAIVLFDELAVVRQSDGLAWDGSAPFQYQEREVKGAQSLYGFWLVQLPWWGWALWAVAIGVFVARMVIKPETENERWDRFRWIGWVAGAVMFLIVFILWDLEMKSVWGTSVFTTNASGTAFWITFGLQLATMSWVLGAVALPLSIIIKNGLLLGRQGTFMGLGKPASLLLAYLIGATLFLAYLELMFNFAFDSIADG